MPTRDAVRAGGAVAGRFAGRLLNQPTARSVHQGGSAATLLAAGTAHPDGAVHRLRADLAHRWESEALVMAALIEAKVARQLLPGGLVCRAR